MDLILKKQIMDVLMAFPSMEELEREGPAESTANDKSI
jgi:hypothetical protein